MIRRARLHRLARAVLTLFATTCVPRAVILVHHHNGDEHEHVHLFGEDPDAHEHVEHHHHDEVFDPDAVELESPEVFHTDHVHWRQPFQRAVAGAIPPLTRGETVASVGADRPARRSFIATVPSQARAPPDTSPTIHI